MGIDSLAFDLLTAIEDGDRAKAIRLVRKYPARAVDLLAEYVCEREAKRDGFDAAVESEMRRQRHAGSALA